VDGIAKPQRRRLALRSGPGCFVPTSSDGCAALLAVGGLAPQVLDHPAGGIGLGGQGRVVGLSQQGDCCGERLRLDAQLPKGAGALQGAGGSPITSAMVRPSRSTVWGSSVIGEPKPRRAC
jgi:hypothetical protein